MLQNKSRTKSLEKYTDAVSSLSRWLCMRTAYFQGSHPRSLPRGIRSTGTDSTHPSRRWCHVCYEVSSQKTTLCCCCCGGKGGLEHTALLLSIAYRFYVQIKGVCSLYDVCVCVCACACVFMTLHCMRVTEIQLIEKRKPRKRDYF